MPATAPPNPQTGPDHTASSLTPTPAQGPRLVMMVLLIMVLCIAGMTAAIEWSGRAQDGAAAERSIRQVEQALMLEMERLTATAGDYAVWDDAVRALTGEPDPDWVLSNLGPNLVQNFNVTRAVVADPGGIIQVATMAGAPTPALRGTMLEPHLRLLADRVATGARPPGGEEATAPGSPGDIGSAPWGPASASALVRSGNEVYLAAAAAVTWQALPTVERAAGEDGPPPPRLLILMKPLVPDLLALLRTLLLLPDLERLPPEAETDGSGANGPTLLPLTGPDGSVIGRMAWTAPTPAADFRQQVRPLAMPLLVAMGVITMLFISRAQAVAQELRDAAQARERSEDRYRALVEAVPDLIALVENGRIVLVNGGGAAILGMPGAQGVVGRLWTDFVTEGDRPAMLRLLAAHGRDSQRGARPEHVWLALRLLRPGGTTAVEITAVPVGPLEGRLALVVARDITKHVEVRESLRQAQTQAALADRAKVQFLSNISHELRTPLNAIIGFSEILKDELLGTMGNPQYKDYAADIHDGGLRLLRLVNDLIDLARIDAGRLDLREAWIDMAALVDRCLRLVGQKAEQGGIALTAEVEEPCRRVLADEVRLKQAVVNLLNNAVTFTQRGGRVALTIAPTAGGDVAVTVSDNGPGMTVEAAALALEAFTQVEGGHNRRQPGAGLGLPLAKGYAEAHGGTLDLTSAPGLGTVVTITLPGTRLPPPSVRSALPPGGRA
ncbi:MAG: histidine protein kinase DivJ [Pseudomonadota bacterium]|jgi:PAS domain S-box-containing protein